MLHKKIFSHENENEHEKLVMETDTEIHMHIRSTTNKIYIIRIPLEII